MGNILWVSKQSLPVQSRIQKGVPGNSKIQYDLDRDLRFDPATKEPLPRVNPVSKVPHKLEVGEISQVLFQQSRDPRGDVRRRDINDIYAQNMNPRAIASYKEKLQFEDLLQNPYVQGYRY